MHERTGVTHDRDAARRETLWDEAVSLAREAIYRFLALALRGPHEPIWVDGVRLADGELLRQAALVTAEAVEQPGEPLAELLGRLADQLHRTPRTRFQEEYDRVFGLLLPRECPPCETEYIRAADVFQRSQVMADVAGFYRAFGLKPARSARERPDHLTLMCEFMATVLAKQRLALADGAREKAEVCVEAAEKFFREHLAWWVPAFCRGLRRKAGEGFYADLADAINQWVTLERILYGVSHERKEPKPELIEQPEEAGGCLECPLLRRPQEDSGE